jgi:hypothetical protein
MIPFTDEEHITAIFGSGLEMPVPAGMVLEESMDAAFDELMEWGVLIFLHDVDNDKVHLICEGGPYQVEKMQHTFFLDGCPALDAKLLNSLPPPFDDSDYSFYFRWTVYVSCLDRDDGLREVESICLRLFGDRSGADYDGYPDALQHLRGWLDGIEFYGEEAYFSSSDEESD